MNDREKNLMRLKFNLRSAEWKFAKTMPHIPHYYTVGQKWSDFSEFIWTANAVVRYGVFQKFFKDPRHYFYLDGWRFWVMDRDPNDAAIINREREDIRKPKWSE